MNYIRLKTPFIMKNYLFILMVLAGFVGLSACGKEDPEEDNDDDDKNTSITIESADQFANLIAGDGKDSSVWQGSQLFRRYWNQMAGEYDPEEEKTNDPNIKFPEHVIWFKYDDYQSPRLGRPVGKGQWIDPLGKTGFNWEMEPGVLDTIFINRMESRPPGGGKQEWQVLSISNTRLECERKWYEGRQEYIDRMIWVKD